MAGSVTHPFVSAKADGADTTKTRPVDWNAAHTFSGLVEDSDFTAYTILMATVTATPIALTVGEQTLVGRKTGGAIAALSGADALLAMGITPLVAELNYVDGVTSAIQDQINAKSPSTAPTFATSITGSYLTASEILITNASQQIVSAPVATYPSLTELSYVKGLTSAIQTQLGLKAPLASPTFTGTISIGGFVNAIRRTTSDTYMIISGGIDYTTGGAVWLYGGDSSTYPGEVILSTPNAAQSASVVRLGITGVTATAVATWANVTHTGIVLSGAITGGSQNMTGMGSINGLVITANTGAITTGTWNGTTIAVANGGTGVTASTGTVAVVLSNTPTLVTPILGVASATSLATSAAIPLLLTYGQLVNISLTSQTVGATTLTIPNFAGVADVFTFNTLSQELLNKTLNASVLKGAFTNDGTVTLPAITLGGAVAGGGQAISALDRQLYNETNLLSNGDFEVGDSPTGWTGEASTLSRETSPTPKVGSYILKVLGDGGANNDATQYIANYLRYAGRKVTLGAWVQAPTANTNDNARISMHDGISLAITTVPKADSWSWKTITLTVDASPTQLRPLLYSCHTVGATDILYVDGAIVVEGDSCPAFSPKPDDILINHHAAAYTISRYETGYVLHTNLGAGAAITITLPQTVTAGFTCRFAVMAAQELRIDPGAAGAIYINGAKQTDDKYITADDEAESIILTADGNGDWIASSVVGTWGVEA